MAKCIPSQLVTLLLISSSIGAVFSAETPGSFLQTSQDPCDQCAEVAEDRATIAELNARVNSLRAQIQDLQAQVQTLQDTCQPASSVPSLEVGSDANIAQWLGLCAPLGSQLSTLRGTARSFVRNIYNFMDMDVPLVLLMELIKEKNLYCLGLGNSFLELRQSVSQTDVSLWSLDPEDVYGDTDYQQVLEATNQVVQQLQVFLALDPSDCTDRLDYYLDETAQYYNRVNHRMGEKIQAWLQTYQRDLQQVISGIPYCANVEYEDVEALISSARTRI